MKIQPLMALVVLSLPAVPGARTAVRGFKARTLALLTLACLLVAAPATAQVNYEIYDGTAYVTSSPNASGDIVIASTFNGYPVTRIRYFAFSGCTSLTSVTIPNSVTHLDQHPARRLRRFCRSRMAPTPEPLLSRAMKLQHVIL